MRHDVDSTVALGVLLAVVIGTSVASLTHPREKGRPLDRWRIGALVCILAATAYWVIATFA